MVNAHPDFYAPHGHQAVLGTCAGGERSAQGAVEWETLVNRVISIPSPEIKQLKLTADEVNRAVPRGRRDLLWAHVYLKGAQQERKRRIFVKQNHVWRFLPTLLAWFPNAKFLLQVRDVRDFVSSCKMVHPGPIVRYGSVYGALRVYEEDQRHALDFLEILPPGRGLLQKYEDLVSAPAETLKRFCEFAGVPYVPTMLEYHKVEREQRLATEDPAMWGNLARPLTSVSVAKFKKNLPWYDIKAIEITMRPLMEQLQYESSTKHTSRFSRRLWSFLLHLENLIRKPISFLTISVFAIPGLKGIARAFLLRRQAR
jgi:hypothetical protein